jgi:hypothetical protein
MASKRLVAEMRADARDVSLHTNAGCAELLVLLLACACRSLSRVCACVKVVACECVCEGCRVCVREIAIKHKRFSMHY